jgi:hypothetical protein
MSNSMRTPARWNGADFLRNVVKAFPYKIHRISGMPTCGTMRTRVLKNLRLDEIDKIIELAQAIEAKHPRRKGSLGLSSSESMVDPADLKELEAALEAIPPPARMEMLALVWIARGDYPIEAFEEALAYAGEYSGSSDVRYLADKWASLATYLRIGLKEMPSNWPTNSAT